MPGFDPHAFEDMMDEIIKQVEDAKEKNLKQAKLIENIKQLGQNTYDLAKKVSALIP